MSAVPLSRQIYSLERLIKLGAQALRKEGARPSEVEMIIADAVAAKATLEAIEPVQDEMRALIRTARQGAA
ncbi:hypothetical protein [Labrys neptuniae]